MLRPRCSDLMRALSCLSFFSFGRLRVGLSSTFLFISLGILPVLVKQTKKFGPFECLQQFLPVDASSTTTFFQPSWRYISWFPWRCRRLVAGWPSSSLVVIGHVGLFSSRVASTTLTKFDYLFRVHYLVISTLLPNSISRIGVFISWSKLESLPGILLTWLRWTVMMGRGIGHRSVSVITERGKCYFVDLSVSKKECSSYLVMQF